MGALKLLAGAALLLAAEVAAAQPIDRWRPYIDEASQRFGIPALWIERVITAESGGRTELHGRPIVSRVGAMGLMQLMPGTWVEIRERLGLGSDPHAPRDNILAGTYYLRLMYDRFGYPGLFGAYNAGPGRYADWLEGRGPLPGETRAYLTTVTRGLLPASDRVTRPPAEMAVRSGLFFAVGVRSADEANVTPEHLFVVAPRQKPVSD